MTEGEMEIKDMITTLKPQAAAGTSQPGREPTFVRIEQGLLSTRLTPVEDAAAATHVTISAYRVRGAQLAALRRKVEAVAALQPPIAADTAVPLGPAAPSTAPLAPPPVVAPANTDGKTEMAAPREDFPAARADSRPSTAPGATATEPTAADRVNEHTPSVSASERATLATDLADKSAQIARLVAKNNELRAEKRKLRDMLAGEAGVPPGPCLVLVDRDDVAEEVVTLDLEALPGRENLPAALAEARAQVAVYDYPCRLRRVYLDKTLWRAEFLVPLDEETPAARAAGVGGSGSGDGIVAEAADALRAIVARDGPRTVI